MNGEQVFDGLGIYGNFFHYGLVIVLVGSAFFIFLYLWKIKRLDMDEEPKFQMMRDEENYQGEVLMADDAKQPVKELKGEEELEFYGDPGIASGEGKVPKFLIANYIFWPLWGLVTLCYFWNGSRGVFDPGYWHELQIAANTTFPIENQDVLEANQVGEEEKLSPVKIAE